MIATRYTHVFGQPAIDSEFLMFMAQRNYCRIAVFALTGLLSSISPLHAEPEQASAPSIAPAQLILLGSFHFANPQADVVKSNVLDVRTEASQQYLQDLSQRLADFKPTRVLLEYDAKDEQEINQQYRAYQAQYKAGESDSAILNKVNELYQIGFRTAVRAGLSRVFSVDEREVNWEADSLFQYMETQDPVLNQKMQQEIQKLSAESERLQTQLSLAGLLKHYNQDSTDAQNQRLYLLTNAAGVPASRLSAVPSSEVAESAEQGQDANTAQQYHFVGADAAASWWRRNFHMYAIIQAHAQPGERIVVIAGQGHTAILKSFARIDSQIELVDVNDYL